MEKTVNEIAKFAPKNVRSLLNSEVAINKMLDFLMTTPDPDEMLRKAGIQRHQLRSLEMDDEVAQCLDTFKDSVVATDWRLEPNQTRASKWLHDMLAPHIENLLTGILDAISYGYSVQEVMYRKMGKRVEVDRAVIKPMQWFMPQRDGSLRYYPEDGSAGYQGIVCDPRKFILAVRRPRYENPYGESLLSRLWFPVTWRREGWMMWLHFMETFGDPIVIGQIPDPKSFVEAMKEQGVRSVIAWQTSSDMDAVTTINASAPGEFERLENALIRRIQKLILGQTLTSDTSQGGGSYALGAVHNQVKNEKRRAALRLCTTAVQRFIDTLTTLNGFQKLTFIMAEDASLESARAARDAVLAPVLAASGLKLVKGYFTDVYDYRDEDLEDKPTMIPVDPTDPQEGPKSPAGDPNAKDDNAEDTKQGSGLKKPTRNRSVSDNGREQAKAGDGE